PWMKRLRSLQNPHGDGLALRARISEGGTGDDPISGRDRAVVPKRVGEIVRHHAVLALRGVVRRPESELMLSLRNGQRLWVRDGQPSTNKRWVRDVSWHFDASCSE